MFGVEDHRGHGEGPEVTEVQAPSAPPARKRVAAPFSFWQRLLIGRAGYISQRGTSCACCCLCGLCAPSVSSAVWYSWCSWRFETIAECVLRIEPRRHKTHGNQEGGLVSLWLGGFLRRSWRPWRWDHSAELQRAAHLADEKQRAGDHDQLVAHVLIRTKRVHERFDR